MACGGCSCPAVRLARRWRRRRRGEEDWRRVATGEAWERQACELSTWAACLPSGRLAERQRKRTCGLASRGPAWEGLFTLLRKCRGLRSPERLDRRRVPGSCGRGAPYLYGSRDGRTLASACQYATGTSRKWSCGTMFSRIFHFFFSYNYTKSTLIDSSCDPSACTRIDKYVSICTNRQISQKIYMSK